MRTDDLIEALSADAASPVAPASRLWLGGLALGLVTSVLLMVETLQVRSDVMQALGTIRFDFKFVATLLLALPAGLLAHRLMDPTAQAEGQLRWLAIAPLALGAAVILELVVLPARAWSANLIGANGFWCLGFVPIYSLPVLGGLFYAMRRGAPTRARLTGLIAGLAAGGFGATVYAAHCTDDSPLFVAVWYTLGIAIVAALGAALGPRLLRW